MSEIFIRGFLLGNDREKVVEAKGETVALQYDQIMGGKKKYIPTKTYPISESQKCLETAATLIYGNTNDESYHKLGIWDFKKISQSQASKVAFSLFAPTFEKAVLNFSKIMEAFFVGLDSSSEIIESNKAELTISNDPYKPSYLMGFLEEAARSYGQEAYITYSNKEDTSRVYTIEWKKIETSLD